jgi:hypothetical protein
VSAVLWLSASLHVHDDQMLRWELHDERTQVLLNYADECAEAQRIFRSALFSWGK